MDHKSSIASASGKKKETSSSPALSSSGHNKSRASLGRVYHACERCRKMKMKCDGVQPTCTRCKSANYDCMWLAKGKPGPKPKAKIPLWGAAREEALRSMGVSASEYALYVSRSASISELETGSTTASSTLEQGYFSSSRPRPQIRVADTSIADAEVEEGDDEDLGDLSASVDPTTLPLLAGSEDGMTSTELRRLAHFMDFIGLSRLPAPATHSTVLPSTPTNTRPNVTLVQESHSVSVSARRIVSSKDSTRNNPKMPQLNGASKTSNSGYESNLDPFGPLSCPPPAHRPSSSGSSATSDILTHPSANARQPRLGDSMCYVRNSLIPADQKLVAGASRHDYSRA